VLHCPSRLWVWVSRCVFRPLWLLAVLDCGGRACPFGLIMVGGLIGELRTACEEAVFGEDCYCVDEEDGDWCWCVSLGTFGLSEEMDECTLEETAE